MAKPKPRRIASDDCAVRVDGETCHPHEGEWVTLITTESVGEMHARVRFSQIVVKLDEISGELDEGRKFAELMDQHYTELCGYLARRVKAWSWTDDFGNPLPQPNGRPETLMALRADEIYWLMNATANRETEAERGNA